MGPCIVGEKRVEEFKREETRLNRAVRSLWLNSERSFYCLTGLPTIFIVNVH